MTESSHAASPARPVRAFLYDADGRDREVRLEPGLVATLTPQQLLWVDASGPGGSVEELAEALGLPDGARAQVAGQKGPPRLTKCGEFLHVTLSALHARSDDRWRPVRTSVLWDRRLVLTIHQGEVDAFEDFTAHIRGESRLGELSADLFVSALLDWHLATYFRAIESLEVLIDRFDERVLTRQPSSQLIDELIGMRRRVSRLRRLLLPQREVFHGLTRPDVGQEVGRDADRHFHGVAQRFEQAREALEHTADLVQGSFALHASRAADATNAFLKALTFATFLLGAMGVIAGLLGMNFQARIFEAGELAFWSVIVGLLVLATTAVFVAKRRGWI